MSKASHIERMALADLHSAATPAMRGALGLTWATIDGVAVSVAAGLDPSAIVINRVPDIDASTPVTPERVGAILALYAAAGVERFFIQSTSPPDASLLPAGGLGTARAWQGFRHQGAISQARSDLAIREIGPEHGAQFGAIVADGFDLGSAAAPWLGRLPGRARWRIFMAFDGAQPVGTGALFVMNGIGWCDWAATAPHARRRGCQSALLAARLAAARAMGCKDVFSCTGAAVPGDPQHSYSNLLRAGFRETDLRYSFAPAAHHTRHKELSHVS